jgi:hypothetical protein
METSKRHGSAALRNGLLFGATCAVVYIVSAFVQDITGTTVALAPLGGAFRPLSLLNQATLVVGLVLFFVAGWRTSRTDERLSSAAGAGFIVGLMVSIVEIATIIVNQAFYYNTIMAKLQPGQPSSACGFQCTLLQAAGAQAAVTFFIYIALGAGLGFVAGALRGQLRQEALWR